MSTEQSSPPAPNLSERELEVLRLVATGATNNQVARELAISVNTVKVHLNNIFAKLGVQSRTEAALYAVRQGWVELKPTAAEVAPPPQASPAPAALPVPVSVSAPTAPTAANASRQRVRVLALALLFASLLAVVSFWARDGLAAFIMPSVAVPTSAPVAPARWKLKTPLAAPRASLAVASVDNVIYVIGGLSAQHALADVSVYDPVADSWSIKMPKPTAAQGIGAAVIGGQIYVPGGCDAQDQPRASLEVYDPLRDAWQTSVPMPRALCHYAISAFEGKLYIFGGWDGQQAVASVYIFDPVRAQWSDGPALPSARANAAAVVANDQLYVVGGRAGERVLDDVLVFAPTQERTGGQVWQPKASLLKPRAQLGLVSLAGNLYALGGGWSRALAENERYDTKANQWIPFEASPEVLWRVGGAVALETKLYVFGGAADKELAAVQEYTALYRFFLPEVAPPSTR